MESLSLCIKNQSFWQLTIKDGDRKNKQLKGKKSILWLKVSAPFTQSLKKETMPFV